MGIFIQFKSVQCVLSKSNSNYNFYNKFRINYYN